MSSTLMRRISLRRTLWSRVREVGGAVVWQGDVDELRAAGASMVSSVVLPVVGLLEFVC